jgi:RHS repeat-associated protein
MNMQGRASWWAGLTAGVTAVVLVVTGLPASASGTPSPEPPASAAPVVTPSPEPPASPSAEVTPSPTQGFVGLGGTDNKAADGSVGTKPGAVGPDGAALVMDGVVTPASDGDVSVAGQPVTPPVAPDSQAAVGSFGAAEVVAPGASSDELTVLSPRSLDALVADAANHPAVAGASIVVGAAVAPLTDLVGSLYGDNAAASLSEGRPDLVAGSLPRTLLGDALSVDVTPQLGGGTIPGAAFAAKVSLDEKFGASWVDVAFDTSGFANAFGGDYGDRLTLMVLPECALTTPNVPGCLVGIPLQTRRESDGVLRAFVPADALSVLDVQGHMSAPRLVDLGTSALTAGMSTTTGGLASAVAGGGTIIAAVSGADSQAGSFKATDLAPRGTWGVTEPAGGFTYSIPITAPPVSAGAAPSLSLNYSSQATDGKTSASNSQAGAVGEGWSMPVSYIERLYKPCTDDGGTTTDLCWDSPYSNALGEAAYVMSLQGSVQELVYVGPGTEANSVTYTAVSDPTLRVTRYFGTAGRNDDDNGEYFKVQTNNGSVYFFGYNPGTTAVPGGTVAPTNSIAYEPVIGNNAGEPGNGATGNLVANQAYRFMLDLTVDSTSNASTYFYARATNKYATGTVVNDYVRDIQLSRIEYGQTFNAATNKVTAPEAKVDFDLVNRCVEGAQFKDGLAPAVDIAGACAQGPSPANAASYPDVPVDLICTGASCNPTQTSPTYFSTVRLNQIKTSVVGDAVNPWVPVETTQLITAFPTTADGSARSLWLDSVYTRGYGGAGTADDVDTYLTKFSGIRLNNRVDWDLTVGTNEVPQRPMDRMRIAKVFTDLGGRIDVTYAQANEFAGANVVDKASTRTGSLGTQVCPQGGKDGADYAAWLGTNPLKKTNSLANDQLCFAVKSGSNTYLYHNYVVTKVALVDLVGGQPTQTHLYSYGGSPAYARGDSVLYAVGGTGDTSTFSSYRGFQTVSSTMGDVAPSVMPVAASPVVLAANLRSADFDGDGKVDLFTADASGQWKYSSGGVGPWVNLGADASVPLADLRFGDFDGDGKADVFSRTSAGQWRYASAGLGGWINLTSDSGTSLADLRLGVFDYDSKIDIFSRTAAGQWRYSSGGVGGYVNIATEGATPVADLRFADFNGDGLTDVFARTAEGQWVYSSGGAVSYVSLSGDSSVPLSALRFADIDGDRKADVVTQNANGTWKFSSGGTVAWATLSTPLDAPLGGTELADFTGDGKADVLMQAPSGERKLWINGTTGWTTVVAAAGTPATPTTSAVTTNQYFRGTGAMLGSLYDGSARPDTDPRLRGRLESSKVVNGAGVTVSKSKPTYTVTSLSTPSWDRAGVTTQHNPSVVLQTSSISSALDSSQAIVKSSVTTYSATTFRPVQTTQKAWSTWSDNLLGITQCSATDYAVSASPYLVVPVASRSYDGTCAAGTLTGKVEIGYDGGTPGSTSQALTAGLVTQERSYFTATASTTSKATYDSRGRIVGAWMPNDVANTTPTVAWAYGADGAAWTTTVTRALGAISTTWTERGHGNTIKVHGATDTDWTHYKYDALGLMTAGWNPTQWGQAATPSLAANIPTVMYRYDIYANGPTLRSTPAVITTAPFVGEVENPDGSTTFPASALTGTTRRTMTFLDGFGRSIEQHGVAPDGLGGRTVTATRYNALGQVDWSSAAFTAAGSMRVLSASGATMLVNPTLASLPNATGYTYDTLGRTTATTSLTLGAPLTVGGTQVKSTYSYQGPMTSATAPNGATTVTTVDEIGRIVQKAVRPDAAHVADAGLSQITSYSYSTLQAAGKVGFQQVTVSDPEGKATVFVSNLAGQRTAMVDPNAGAASYMYDANGQSTSVTSPAGTITMGYDASGRMVSRTTGGSLSATWDYVEPGESGAATDLGLLRSSTSTTHTSLGDLTTTTSASYDTLHRPVSSTTTLPTSPAGSPNLLGDLSGTSYTTTAGYDALGQPTTAGLPAMGGLPAESVTTGLRKSGSAEKLTLTSGGVSTPLVTGVTYSGTGQMLSRTYGNGVTRAYGWDTVTRALTGLSASFVTSESGSAQTAFVQKDSFTRDVMGRIVTSTNEVPVADNTAAAGQVTAECFTYDGFNRLSGAWTVAGTGAATCGTAAPANATATGWDASTTAYAAKWSYSTGGRITSLVKGAAGAPATSAYTYTDTAHPAAVTQVTGGTTTDSFGYDTAGRMVSRTVNGVSTALTWDVTSSLVDSNGQGGHVVYAYDPSGQRVAQARVADANGVGTATAYVASGQVDDPNTASTSTGDLSATRYYTFGGSTVAIRTNDGQLSLMLGDEQGSTNVMMPVHGVADGTLASATLADASAVTRNSYTPYGQLRGADNLATDRGWLGQVEDRVDGASGTGLTYLNARYYDPATSRFISPDPLMNPGDPKTLDPYRYADNNPVVFTDASGLCSSTGSWGYDGGSTLEPPCTKINGDQYSLPAPTTPDTNHGYYGYVQTSVLPEAFLSPEVIFASLASQNDLNSGGTGILLPGMPGYCTFGCLSSPFTTGLPSGGDSWEPPFAFLGYLNTAFGITWKELWKHLPGLAKMGERAVPGVGGLIAALQSAGEAADDPRYANLTDEQRTKVLTVRGIFVGESTMLGGLGGTAGVALVTKNPALAVVGDIAGSTLAYEGSKRLFDWGFDQTVAFSVEIQELGWYGDLPYVGERDWPSLPGLPSLPSLW